MDLREQCQQLLNEVREALNLDSLSLDNNDECSVVIEERTLLIFTADEETRSLVISSPITTLTDGPHREAVLFELATGNYFWGLTDGGSIGLDRSSGLIAYCYLVEVPLIEGAVFTNIVAKVVNVVEFWQRRLADLMGDENPASTAVPLAAPFNPTMRV